MTITRSLRPDDRSWLVAGLKQAFGDVVVVRRATSIDASILPGFVALDGEQRAGFLTYQETAGSCEVVAIVSLHEGEGIGRALMEAVYDHALREGCHRLWLITTNDNSRAFRFYQMWGMDLCAFHRNGVDRARVLKPTIPPRGLDGIPLKHELELELLLVGGGR
jgi:GNAT superfamily N-acetyltransferase